VIRSPLTPQQAAHIRHLDTAAANAQAALQAAVALLALGHPVPENAKLVGVEDDALVFHVEPSARGARGAD